MTTVQHIFRRNTLGALLRQPGGVRVDEAIETAERNIASIQAESVSEVDRNMDLLTRSAARAAADPSDHAAREEVYAHANVIAGLAGCCGLADVGEAAFNLCELSDRYIIANHWNTDAVAVHLSAMAVLRSLDTAGGPEIRRSVLNGLVELVRQADGLLAVAKSVSTSVVRQ